MTLKNIKFQTQVIGDTLVYERAAKICIALIGVLILMYAYAVGSTVHLVMQRLSNESSGQKLTSQISELESNYLKLSQSINLSRGEVLGLHEAKNISFVTRALPSVSTLSLNTSHEL